jgi:hypothetical protein
VLCLCFLCLARGQRVLLGCRAQKSLYSFARHGWCVPRCGHASVCCHTVHTHHVPSTHRPFAVSTPPTPTSLRRQRHVLDSDLRRERRVHATVLPHGHMLGCRAPAPPLTGATESLRHQFPPPTTRPCLLPSLPALELLALRSRVSLPSRCFASERPSPPPPPPARRCDCTPSRNVPGSAPATRGPRRPLRRHRRHKSHEAGLASHCVPMRSETVWRQCGG